MTITVHGVNDTPVGTDDAFARIEMWESQQAEGLARAKATLGWEPTVQLREGLGATIEYFRGSLNL